MYAGPCSKTMVICTVPLFPFFLSPSSWGLPFLYSLLEAIVALHLLII